jgi:hypothetical protein
MKLFLNKKVGKTTNPTASLCEVAPSFISLYYFGPAKYPITSCPVYQEIFLYLFVIIADYCTTLRLLKIKCILLSTPSGQPWSIAG